MKPCHLGPSFLMQTPGFKILTLDLSTSTGWAFSNTSPGQATFNIDYGVIKLDKPIHEHAATYPWSYLLAVAALVSQIEQLVEGLHPDIIVIEETNGSRARYTQKVLEFIHFGVLQMIAKYIVNKNFKAQVVYINTSDWRKVLGLHLTKDDKKKNAKLAKAKRDALKKGEKLDKKKLGIKGKVNKKHVAIRFVNDKLGLELKAKDDDIADAICLLLAYLADAPHCDGRK